MMKFHYLLLTFLFGFTSLFAATGTKEDPYELVSGDNPINFGSNWSVFFTYTPTEDELLVLTMTNCNFYGGITTEGPKMNDTFNGKSYIQTKANNTYVIEISKGWGSESPNLAMEPKPTPFPDGISWDTAVEPTPYLSFISTGSYVPGYMKYTATESGVLQFFFSAYINVTYSTEQFTPEEASTKNKMVTSYTNGGGYRGNIEVEAGKTYWFFLEGNSSMLCSAELIHPEIGKSADFPFTVNAGDNIRFPKETGKYYYSIANNGNSGYLILDGSEAFSGTANAGPSFDYPSQTSADKINIRLSVSSSYKAYCLTLDRTEEAAADQTFSAFYSNEAYDAYPGLEVEKDVVVTTPKYPGLYYYRITVPEGAQVMNIVPETEPTDATTEASLYQGNYYSALTKGKEIHYEAVAGKEYTIGWRVAEKDAPFAFKVSFTTPPSGDSPSSPLPAVLGENSVPVGEIKYFEYTATQDCKLAITPAEGSGLGMPSVSMLPVPEDPYMQACDVAKDGDAYLVAAQKNRGYLIIFKNIAAETSFTIEERQNVQGESPADPIIIEGNEAALPEKTGIYWFKYTVPRTGKLEISTTLAYEMAENHQDYTYVYFYNPDDLHNRAGELRADLDGKAFFKRVLNKTEGDEIYFAVRIVTPQEGKTLNLLPRDPIAGEVAEQAIPIPFNGSEDEFKFSEIVNHEEEGIWYSIPLTEGNLSVEGITPGTFSLALYAPDNTTAELAKSGPLGFYYNEAEEMYLYTYGFRDYEVKKAGTYYIFLADCELPFTASIVLAKKSGVSSAAANAAAVVSTAPGCIVVAGVEGTVSVMRADGASIAKVDGKSNFTIPVAPGFYIVSANGRTYKVLVK